MFYLVDAAYRAGRLGCIPFLARATNGN